MFDPATAAGADKILIVRDHPGLVAVAAVAENVVEIGLGQAKAPARQLVGGKRGGVRHGAKERKGKNEERRTKSQTMVAKAKNLSCT